MLSDAYFRSPYCEDEWTGAFVRDEQGRDRLLPVRVEDCRLPCLLATRTFVDLVGLDAAAATTRLLDGVARARGQRGKPEVAPTFPGERTGRGFLGERQRFGTCGHATRTSPGVTR